MAVINQPDMKTNFVHLLLEFSNNIVSRCFDLRNVLTIFLKDDFTPIFAQSKSLCICKHFDRHLMFNFFWHILFLDTA